MRSDYHTALLCLVLAKVNGNKDAKLADFFLDFDRTPAEPQTVEEIEATLREWAAATAHLTPVTPPARKKKRPKPPAEGAG